MRPVNLSDPQGTPRIFVSYARADGEEAARELLKLLTENDLSAWLDHLDLDSGIDWWRQVESALQRVEHLGLVLTPAALNSPNVEREWRYARRQGVQVTPVEIGGGILWATLGETPANPVAMPRRKRPIRRTASAPARHRAARD